jgi:hypothetical protein
LVRWKKEILEGLSPTDALNKTGYGQGALKALDFYTDGINYQAYYNQEKRKWDIK